jgi:Bifunctional DNA primase/polymerase, N-terminal/Primase C terminal 1 (PriCT-1)
MNDDLRQAALYYAKRGWAVIPLHTPQGVGRGCSCGKMDCTAVGKHPRTKNGLHDASIDPREVQELWTRWPDANIGIATGREFDLMVLDLDNKNGKRGYESLAALEFNYGSLPATLTATTGCGEHLFFCHRGAPVKSSVGKLGDGVDVRAEGGYVVAAPSLHASGKQYAWTGDPEHTPLADVPGWLLNLMMGTEAKMGYVETQEPNAFSDAESIHEGERNDTLYKLGCALRGQHGKEHDEILSILLEYNNAKCNPPLDSWEVLKIVDSVCKHPAEVAAKKSANRQDKSPLYWFKFNTREWFADQNLALMTDYQTGWYIRLKAYAWDKGGFLPADHDKLRMLAKAKGKKVFERDCVLVLAEYEEVEIDGQLRLKNPRMVVEYADTLEKWMRR